jgi:predicted ABC-type exoprotein transport system permease subunit
MTLDTELAALWSKEVAREYNPAFSIAVMQRIQRALYRRALVRNIAAVSAATLFFIIFAPMLTTVWQQSFAHFFNGLTLAFLLSALSIFLSKCLRLG